MNTNSCCVVSRYFLFLAAVLFSGNCYAQFNAGIQGVVQDPSGAAVAKANVTLLNEATQVAASTTSDDSGNYRFVSLAPGTYTVSAQSPGFSKSTVQVRLETDQNRNVPISLTVASASQNVVVTGEAPLLNTAETRNQLTLETQTLSTLPLAGRNMISLASLAPGAVGTGTSASGSPGSGVDNFSTETQVDLSANGQGSVGNMFIVDGLDVTSAIRPGVLNLTPNPDSIAETSIQTNTYNVEYGRASSLQMAITTKSGTDSFHGNVSDYFTDQHLFAGTEFNHSYSPFHSNNISATIGGPIIPNHQFFFFFSIEPLRSSSSSGSLVTIEDPAFTQWAQTTYPNTLGTKLLKYIQADGRCGNQCFRDRRPSVPGNLRDSGRQLYSVQSACDRYRLFHFVELSQWAAIFSAYRQVLQKRSPLWKLLPHDARLRLAECQAGFQHHEQHRAEGASSKRNSYVFSRYSQ